ncbi:hypothetical protein RQP46_002685 [Phenoliferia psychrophenolica]
MPPALAFVASLPTTPSTSALLVAITSLLQRYPLLSCVITDVRTTTPIFKQRAVIADEVLMVEEEAEPRTAEEALLFGLEAAAKIDVEEGPLWNVHFLRTKGEEGPSRLILAVNHTVSDGAGTKALLVELLNSIFSPNPSETPEEALTTLPPTMEASIDVRPPWLLMLREVFAALIVPRLPSLLRPTPPIPVYPSPPLIAPHTRHTAVRLATFPSSLVASLKAVGASNGVATIHPILHSCLLTALFAASSALPGKHEFATGTAISVRDSKLHPTATGNYVASLTSSYSSSSSTPPAFDFDFWGATREYARRVTDPTERAWAKGTMGMMTYIPDGVQGSETGWEVFLKDQVQAEHPWKFTAGLSNLGAVKVPLAGVEVAWAQTAPGVGCFEFNVISVQDGAFAVSLSWRDGTVHEGAVDRLWTAFQTSIEKVASG